MNSMRKSAAILLLLANLISFNTAQANDWLTRILDPQAAMKADLDKARQEQAARDQAQQAKNKEENDRSYQEYLEREQKSVDESKRQIKAAAGQPLNVTYNHVPASLKALACAQPDDSTECKFYFDGFAETVAMIYASSSKGNGICGNTDHFVDEFLNEVRSNKKSSDTETHQLLFSLLVKNHSCSKKNNKSILSLSAGYLLNTCQTGDVGFKLCSQYEAGFVSAILFLSEKTATPILCGHPGLIEPTSISNQLNDAIKADPALANDAAVTVMFDFLSERMPCGNVK